MTRTSNGRSATRLAQAQILRALETSWRNWRAFIAERREELAQRAADEAGVDDLTTPVGAGAAVRKARINAATRQELAMILEQRRQAAQRDAEAAARPAGAPLPDVEQVLERLIARIGDELEGRVLANGNALVWFEGQLVEFDYRAVSAGTTDDDYLAAGGFDALRERRRRILIGIVAIACLGGALLLLLNPFGGGQPTAAASGPTLGEVAQQDTALWDIQSLAVGPVGGRLSGAALGYPTLICLSEPQQQAAKPGETVVLSGTMSVRTYMLHGSPSAMPRDLIVADCTQSPPRLLASAELKSAQTARPLDARTIAAVATTGADNDPANIPSDRMRVDLTVSHADAAQGTLILADGSRWSPTSSKAAGDATVLSYLVPLQTSMQVAGWELGGAGGLPALLPVQIPAPHARAELLRQSLTVTATGAEVSTRNGSPLLTLTLKVTLAQTAAPLTLLPSDLVLRRSVGARPPEWDPPALEPGVPATVRIAIPLQEAAASLEAALGPWHARLRW